MVERLEKIVENSMGIQEIDNAEELHLFVLTKMENWKIEPGRMGGPPLRHGPGSKLVLFYKNTGSLFLHLQRYWEPSEKALKLASGQQEWVEKITLINGDGWYLERKGHDKIDANIAKEIITNFFGK
jgi:hypothetical protein